MDSGGSINETKKQRRQERKIKEGRKVLGNVLYCTNSGCFARDLTFDMCEWLGNSHPVTWAKSMQASSLLLSDR
jgi:hypothetical protein